MFEDAAFQTRRLLRAIFQENRKSQDTRKKIEFFSFAKTSLLVTLFKKK